MRGMPWPAGRTIERLKAVVFSFTVSDFRGAAMALFNVSDFKEGRYFRCPGVGDGLVISRGAGSTRVKWLSGGEESISRGTQVQPIQKPEEQKTAKVNKRLVFGKYSATAVLRKLGSLGWEPEEAMFVFESLTIAVSLSTVKIQIVAGSKGKRGEPAPLTEGEVDKLDSMLKAMLEEKTAAK